MNDQIEEESLFNAQGKSEFHHLHFVDVFLCASAAVA